MASRQDIPRIVSALLGRRPVRWAPMESCLADFDGWANTLEVFNADPGEQRRLLAGLRARREELDQLAGGRIVFVFHTCRESARLYGDFMTSFQLEPRLLEAPPNLVKLPCLDVPVQEGAVGSDRRAA